MKYTLDYPESRAHVDTDRIVKKHISGRPFVRFSSKEDRIRFIEFLEAEGFSCEESRSFSRQSTIDSDLPLVIDYAAKSIRHMGNVTCAAAAAGAGVIMSDRDFYLLYSLDKATKR